MQSTVPSSAALSGHSDFYRPEGRPFIAAALRGSFEGNARAGDVFRRGKGRTPFVLMPVPCAARTTARAAAPIP